MVTIRFAFEGGWTQDPPGKEGLTRLMTGLFDEGAGGLDSNAFQKRLDDAGAEMGFGAGRDTVYGTMRMLADNQNEAFELLTRSVRNFPDSPVAGAAHLLRARILDQWGRSEEAEQTRRRVREFYPGP